MKFYGTRGSIPVCEPNFQEFGGNTTCIGLYHHDRIGIIDAGTGIRTVGKEILERDSRAGQDRFRRSKLVSQRAVRSDGDVTILPAFDEHLHRCPLWVKSRH